MVIWIMPTERRDELRQRLDEMEATVRGLTQELVEANERIRQLEEHVEEQPATKPMPSDAKSGASDESEDDTQPEDLEEEDDIIVA